MADLPMADMGYQEGLPDLPNCVQTTVCWHVKAKLVEILAEVASGVENMEWVEEV